MHDSPAPTLRLLLRDDDHDAPLELPLPERDPDPDVQRAVEAEHYDEQILAALVFP